MRIADIKADLANGELSGIEAAFRALVGGKGRIRGAADLDDLWDLVQPVCAALAYDDRRMPSHLAAVIGREMGQDLAGRTYAAGAHAVWNQNALWRGLLKQRYPALSEMPACSTSPRSRATVG